MIRIRRRTSKRRRRRKFNITAAIIIIIIIILVSCVSRARGEKVASHSRHRMHTVPETARGRVLYLQFKNKANRTPDRFFPIYFFIIPRMFAVKRYVHFGSTSLHDLRLGLYSMNNKLFASYKSELVARLHVTPRLGIRWRLEVFNRLHCRMQRRGGSTGYYRRKIELDELSRAIASLSVFINFFFFDQSGYILECLQ